MFLTIMRFAKKAKSKHVLVSCESLVTGHKVNRVRERLADKLEFMFFDPYVKYFKYLPAVNLQSIADHVIKSALIWTKGEVSDYGFGKSYQWRSLSGGLQEAKITRRPIFFLIHKVTCPSCLKLKDKFSKSVKLIDLSNHFVMINVENSSDMLSYHKEFTPDGKYVPRILFFTADGNLIYNAYNRYPDADPKHRYYYSSPVQVIDVMQQVIDNGGRNPLPEPPAKK